MTGRNLRREAGSGKGVGGGCQTPERGQRGGHRRSFFPRRPFPRQRGGPDAHSQEDPGRRPRGPYSLRTLPRIVRPAQGAGRERRSSAAGRSRRSASPGLPPLKTPAAHAGEARAVRPRGAGRAPRGAPPAEPGQPTGPGQWRGAAARTTARPPPRRRFRRGPPTPPPPPAAAGVVYEVGR